MATCKKLLWYCKAQQGVIFTALALAALGSLLNILGPSQLSRITDLITQGLGGSINMAAIGGIGLLLMALYGLGFVFNYLQNYLMAGVTAWTSKKLRGDISGKMNRLPLSYYDSASYGDVLSRITNDVDTVGQALNQSLGTLISSVATIVGCLALMLWQSPVLTLAAVAAAAAGFGLMLLIMSKSQVYFTSQQRELGKLNGLVEEAYSGHSIIKAYNGEDKARRQFDQSNEELTRSAWKAQFFSGIMQPVMSFTGNLGYVAVCVAGAILTLNGQITFGVVVAFMLYVRLFTQPFSQIAQAATSLQSAAAAGERVFQFLEEDELEPEGKRSAPGHRVKGNVTFEKVGFAYPGGKRVLEDFSAQVRAGQKVAIVGPTGTGKTTIVNLLMRFYEVGEGAILIDGVPIGEMTREEIHDQFCMVLQDTWLFEGTVEENIIFGRPGITREQVVEACKAAGVHGFVETLPMGYETVLTGETSLSAGQKQLLTIARAMVSDAPMLILDEATSSVDTRTELLIGQAMDRLSAGRTSFVIAHRLSTIKNADCILVMSGGGVAEQGTHQQLMDMGGIYAGLYNSQFEQAA